MEDCSPEVLATSILQQRPSIVKTNSMLQKISKQIKDTLETLGTPRTIWKELEFLQIWSLENYSFGSNILTLVITQGKAGE